jgi:hypothetical protein
MHLTSVIPWGRSFDEYRRMFALTGHDLLGHVLGVGDGPASFNAEATALGHCVTSADPIYAFSADEIRSRIAACYDTVLAHARAEAHRFVWTDFPTPEALGAARLAAMERFLADYDRGRKERRYVPAALPNLPFPSGRFSLCLCSHLLFLYSGHLDLAFHVDSIQNMLHVAAEARIFPLLDLTGTPSRHVGPVMDALRRGGWEPQVRHVPYEFQRGGNQMMVVHAGG